MNTKLANEIPLWQFDSCEKKNTTKNWVRLMKNKILFPTMCWRGGGSFTVLLPSESLLVGRDQWWRKTKRNEHFDTAKILWLVRGLYPQYKKKRKRTSQFTKLHPKSSMVIDHSILRGQYLNSWLEIRTKHVSKTALNNTVFPLYATVWQKQNERSWRIERKGEEGEEQGIYRGAD